DKALPDLVVQTGPDSRGVQHAPLVDRRRRAGYELTNHFPGAQVPDTRRQVLPDRQNRFTPVEGDNASRAIVAPVPKWQRLPTRSFPASDDAAAVARDEAPAVVREDRLDHRDAMRLEGVAFLAIGEVPEPHPLAVGDQRFAIAGEEQLREVPVVDLPAAQHATVFEPGLAKDIALAPDKRPAIRDQGVRDRGPLRFGQTEGQLAAGHVPAEVSSCVVARDQLSTVGRENRLVELPR